MPYVGTLKRLNIPVGVLASNAVGLEKDKVGYRLVFGLMMAIGAIIIGFTDAEVGKWMAIRLGLPH